MATELKVCYGGRHENNHADCAGVAAAGGVLGCSGSDSREGGRAHE